MAGGMHWLMLPVQATSAAFQATHPGLANAKWLPTWRTRNTASPFMCARLPAPAGAMCVQLLSSDTPHGWLRFTWRRAYLLAAGSIPPLHM